MSTCVFCRNFPPVCENELAYALYDIKPISRGHALIIPRRHSEQIFDISPEEFAAMRDIMHRMREIVTLQHAPDGFNIWVNCGQAAGQVVMHTHMHLIPRYRGEVIHVSEHLKGNIE